MTRRPDLFASFLWIERGVGVIPVCYDTYGLGCCDCVWQGGKATRCRFFLATLVALHFTPVSK